MVGNLYMVTMNRKRYRKWDFIQSLAPYVAIGVLVLVLLVGVDSLKQDRVTSNIQIQPAEVVQEKAKDWTHKLSLGKDDGLNHVDDNNEEQCPKPTGNWANTCQKTVTIEGPCNGKCLLKAVCEDLKFQFKETTFEYGEGRSVEIKNVNGLLCKLDEDGAPVCGVNFHGNIASKNCQGYVPRRTEINPTGKSDKGEDAKRGEVERAVPHNDMDFDRDDLGRWEGGAGGSRKKENKRVEPVYPAKRNAWEDDDDDDDHDDDFEAPSLRKGSRNRKAYEDDDDDEEHLHKYRRGAAAGPDYNRDREKDWEHDRMWDDGRDNKRLRGRETNDDDDLYDREEGRGGRRERGSDRERERDREGAGRGRGGVDVDDDEWRGGSKRRRDDDSPYSGRRRAQREDEDDGDIDERYAAAKSKRRSGYDDDDQYPRRRLRGYNDENQEDFM